MKSAVSISLATIVLTAVSGLAVATTAPTARADDPLPDPVIGAVGDMACDSSNPNFFGGLGTATNCGESATSDALIADTSIGAVLGLGDYQYECGDTADYEVSYNPTWGRIDDRIEPVAGNHEYLTGTDVYGGTCPSDNNVAANYFSHFAATAHQDTAGHFSFDTGSWHLIALNANCGKKNVGTWTNVGGCGAYSAQTKWLKADLAATTQPCVLAFWHQPLLTGLKTAVAKTYRPWWNALYAAGADVVLNGHIHNYQRYAAADPYGNPTSAGITEYVVGTGGETQVKVAATAVPQPIAWARSFGYLRLTLHATGWDADFLDPSGTILDTSTGVCH